MVFLIDSRFWESRHIWCLTHVQICFSMQHICSDGQHLRQRGSGVLVLVSGSQSVGRWPLRRPLSGASLSARQQNRKGCFQRACLGRGSGSGGNSGSRGSGGGPSGRGSHTGNLDRPELRHQSGVVADGSPSSLLQEVVLLDVGGRLHSLLAVWNRGALQVLTPLRLQACDVRAAPGASSASWRQTHVSARSAS